MPSTMCVALELLPERASVRAEWEALAVAAANVFATPDFLLTWWRHFGRGRPLRLVGCRDETGRLTAVFPLYLWSARPSVLRFLGHGTGARMGPICGHEDKDAAAAGLRQALVQSSWDVFVAEYLPGEERWPRALRAGRALSTPSPRLVLAGRTWNELLAERSGNFRSELGRKERRLARDHDLRYRLVDEPGELPRALDVLFALHRERWGESQFTAAEGFHRAFAAVALRRGWLRLWLLEIDGRPIAAWYGFRFAGVDTYYQAGRDRSWAAASPGLVLLAHSVREAATDGMREYRFGPGAQQYKYRFGSDDPGLDTIAIGRGAFGRAAIDSVLAARRYRPLRELVRRAVKL